MPEYEVFIDVIEIRGSGVCPSGHKIGQTFSMGDPKLCLWAWHVLLPFAAALRFGGEVPWKDKDKDTLLISCPDPDNNVIFKLRRKLKT